MQYTQKIHKVAVSNDRSSIELFEVSSDEIPLVVRQVYERENNTVGFSVNSVGSFFAVIYEDNWYPCQVLEVDLESEDAYVDFYKRQKGGYFIKEKNQCWVKFVEFLSEIPGPQSSSRRFSLGQQLVSQINGLFSGRCLVKE